MTSEWAADLHLQIAETSAASEATRRAMDEALAEFEVAFAAARQALDEALLAA